MNYRTCKHSIQLAYLSSAFYSTKQYTRFMTENGLKTKIRAFPTSPGVYLHKDAKGEILYVGKAKNLRSRVRSYFATRANLDPAKVKMVSLIRDVDFIATHTELEALVLEATLVRKHQPPYNVLLRDDKFYLFIKITKEKPPRIFPVRKIIRDGSRYFGPYSSASSVRATLRLLRRIFPFKGEKDTPHDIVFPHPLFAPRPLPEQEGGTDSIIAFLKGNRKEIIKTLEEGIKEASDNLEFERAALFRDQLNAILRLEGSQTVYLPRKESFDVVSIAKQRTQSAANILQVREGRLIGKQTFLLRHRADAEPKDILRQFIVQYYAVAQDRGKTILIPMPLSDTSLLSQWISQGGSPVSFAIPKRGVRRKLMEMGTLNAKQFLNQQNAQEETTRASKEALQELLKAIGMDQQPHFAPPAGGASRGESFRVEIYDISNIQGTLATASMAVFTDGMPDKKEYRKFKIRQDGAPNDFAMLHETLSRRLANTDWKTPDLIIIDGGKGQLSAAMRALNASGKHIPIISIAKREEEIFLPNQKDSVRLPYDSPALYLIQRMRDEAHRFTITYHKTLRGKEQVKSVLDEIPGIGPKTKKLLRSAFGSVKRIREASDDELIATIGKQKTAIIREYL